MPDDPTKERPARGDDLVDCFSQIIDEGSDDGRRVAERYLDVVLAVTRCRAGAVFKITASELVLFAASRSIDVDALARAREAWRRSEKALEDVGVTIASCEPPGHGVLIAAIRDGSGVVGLLYLEPGDEGFSHHAVRRAAQCAIVFRSAMEASARVQMQSSTSSEMSPIASLARRELQNFLKGHEWGPWRA